MEKFQMESNNFQIAISNDWRWGSIPEWDEESLALGYVATEHNVYVGTAGDDYSHSALINITVFNPDESPEMTELGEYTYKGMVPFVSGYKQMSFRSSLGSPQDKVTLTLDRPHAAFRLWVESTDYPTKIIICLKDAYSSMS